MDKKEIAVVIQAGGRSSRMGQNKALMDIQGKTVIERTCERIGALGNQTYIISEDINLYAFVPQTRGIFDLFPGQGPLGGFITAFECVPYAYIVMCACDMPFASPELFQLELDFLADQQTDVVLAKIKNRFEPLHAVYRRESCLNPAKQIFNRGGRKIVDWFTEVKVRILDEGIISEIDPQGHAFFNINTPEDYASAQSIYLNHMQMD
jgi:molybdopterin-guanine dinucleotide biosynthesis protein A